MTKHFAPRAVLTSFGMLLALYVTYLVLGNLFGAFTTGSAAYSFFAEVVVPVLLFVYAGFSAAVLAGRSRLVNAALVGVLFGALVWLALKLATLTFFASGSEDFSVSAGVGTGIIGTIGAVVGGGIAEVVARIKSAA